MLVLFNLECHQMAASTSTLPLRPAAQPLHAAITRFFTTSLFALVFVSFVALAGTGKLDALSLIIVFVSFGVRSYQIITNKPWLISEKLSSRLTLFYFALGVADFFFISGELVGTTVHLVLFIMVVKLFSVQTPRDHFYLALIAFMMVLSAAILTVDGFFLAAFCFFLLLAASTFISMEIERSLRMAQVTKGSSVATASSAAMAARIMHSLSKAAAWIVACTVIGAGIIFFLLPRTSAGYMSAFTQRNEFVSGFSDEVRLGAIGHIQQSTSVVMRVRFNSQNVPHDLHWRGAAYSHFDGVSWASGSGTFPTNSGPDGKLDLQQPQISQLIAGVRRDHAPAAKNVVGYEVLMEPIGTNMFFLLPIPLAVNSNSRNYLVSYTGYVMGNDANRAIARYNGNSELSQPNDANRQSTVLELPHDKTNYLQLPDNLDPRIPKLSADVTKEQISVYSRAVAIESYLQSKFAYSLDMSTPPGKDPVAWFLFDRRIGHCEYFASAMAVMLRTQGIPSRIINGFHGGEYNDVSGSYIIRARDAHSWVEAYIPGFGWATFDPTPAAETTSHTGWNRIALYADAIREFWREWVVNYDFTHQETLARTSVSTARQNFDHLRIWSKAKYEALLAAAKSSKEAAAGRPRLFAICFGIVLVLCAVLFNLRRWIVSYRTYRLSSSPSRSPKAAATIWYQRLIRFLARRGFEKSPSQTPQEFAISIEETSIRSEVSQLILYYEKARFGDSPQDAEFLPAIYAQIEASVKQ
jgi:transglutaminase-like putative cysteine protease